MLISNRVYSLGWKIENKNFSGFCKTYVHISWWFHILNQRSLSLWSCNTFNSLIQKMNCSIQNITLFLFCECDWYFMTRKFFLKGMLFSATLHRHKWYYMSSPKLPCNDEKGKPLREIDNLFLQQSPQKSVIIILRYETQFWLSFISFCFSFL